MNKILIYEEGHIWFWNDPVYENKDAGKCIPNGEGCERYSRLVLIVQSTPTISNEDVFIVPITSTKKSNTVEITMLVNGKMCIGYAMPYKLMPVHTAQLENYKCRVSEDDLNKVRSKIAGLLGLQYESSEIIVPEFTPLLTTVIEDSEVKENNTSNVIEATSTSKSFPEKKWDEAAMKEFLEIYSKDPKEAVTVYGISKSSAMSYSYKFRKKLKELANVNKEEKAETEKVTTPAPVVENPTPITEVTSSTAVAPNMGKSGYSSVIVEKSLSRLSNAIRDDLMNKDIYHKINMDPNLYSQGGFYQTLGKSIYFAMCEYTGLINATSHKVSRIKEEKQGTYDKFYNFLKVYYKNPTIRSMKTLKNVCDIIRSQYNGEIPIDMIDILYTNEKKSFTKISSQDAETYFRDINDFISRYYMT